MSIEWVQNNLGNIWAYLTLQELRRFGCEHIFISPGHRNASFITALAACPDMRRHVVMDERAAGYQALGYAKATGKPGVVICTSGTAACNYFPAVAEAARDHIPLVVISADRPFALIHTGANQVMKQNALFGEFVKQTMSMPEPTLTLSPAGVMEHIALVCRRALSAEPGPVHINMPFSEPLGPFASGETRLEVYWQQAVEALQQRQGVPCGVVDGGRASDETWDYFLTRTQRAQRGLLLIGPSHISNPALIQLTRDLQWPVYIDYAAQYAIDPALQLVDAEFSYMRTWLNEYQADCIVHIGKRLTSKWFDQVRGKQIPADYFVINPSLSSVEDIHFQKCATIALNEEAAVQRWRSSLTARTQAAAASVLLKKSRRLREQMAGAVAADDWCSVKVLRDLEQRVGKSMQWFIGNSSAIRIADVWGGRDERTVAVNRGVSGIEGNVATSLGLALGRQKPVLCLLGDVSMIHDLNSLLEIARADVPVKVVIFNNHEGGIFKRLPIAQFPDVMTPGMTSPHAFNFAGMAAMAGIPYFQANHWQEWHKQCALFLEQPHSAVMECLINTDQDLAFYRIFQERISL